MWFTPLQKSALQTLVTVWVAFAVGIGAIALSVNPAPALPPFSDIHTGASPEYTGSRLTLQSGVEVPPPQGCQDVLYFADEAELREYLGTLWDYGDYNTTTGWGGPPAPLRGDAAMAAGGAESGAPPQYSTTNNQVAGVDELDIVKTDGWFIYAVSGNSVVILRSYPPDQMQVVTTLKFDAWPQGIFVNGDRLVVVLNGWGPYYVMDGGADIATSIWPGYYQPSVRVLLYDLSDRNAPALLQNMSVSGSFSAARMIGDFVYLVASHNIYALDGDLQLPTVEFNGLSREAQPSEIGRLGSVENTTLITTILSLNVTGTSVPHTWSYLAPAYGQVYVSARNLYVLGTAWNWDSQSGSGFAETAVSKFSFYRGEVLCYFSGRVPGGVLDQFSADEFAFDGHPYLRLATTVRVWNSTVGSTSASIYVLNETMARVGALENIAPGESVQSSRFVGERGYLVTFRQVDPLFVIDLSDPAHPAVLGELTLPGFSQYLQPIDATHLIGVGVGGTEEGRITGLKVSLFDVSDEANPREVDSYAFGLNAYSAAQYDHRAVLYDAGRQVLVIPVSIYSYGTTYPYDYSGWQGAYVLGVDLAAGFTLLATIEHEGIRMPATYGYSYEYQPSVQRSLYIGDFLYTVSDVWVLSHDFADFSEVGRIQLRDPYADAVAGGGGGGEIRPL